MITPGDSPTDAAQNFDPDDERFRLVTGFNDIFVSIGVSLVLGDLWFISRPHGGTAVVLTSWALAEVFTRRLRMALPSILLSLSVHPAALWRRTTCRWRSPASPMRFSGAPAF